MGKNKISGYKELNEVLTSWHTIKERICELKERNEVSTKPGEVTNAYNPRTGKLRQISLGCRAKPYFRTNKGDIAKTVT